MQIELRMPHLLKMLAIEITPSLTKIFKQSISKGKNPNDWKIQFISPILKPGKDKLMPESYRPISITSICCKIFEHIVYSQILDHLQRHNILTNLQHGYRQGSSTETQLLKVIIFRTFKIENIHSKQNNCHTQRLN